MAYAIIFLVVVLLASAFFTVGAIIWDIGFNMLKGKESSALPFYGIPPLLISAFLIACFLLVSIIANLK